MNKFDLFNYFFLKEIEQPNKKEDDENVAQNSEQALPSSGQVDVNNPQMAQQNSGANDKNQSQNALLKNQTSQNSSVFSNFVGSTISDIGFKKVGSNGGELSISLSKSNMPLKISWVGDKVTVTQPNGNIVSL